MEKTETEEAPSEIFKILDCILKTDKQPEILQKSEDLKNFIKANKPGLQFLELEFDKIFNTITDLEKLLDQLASILESWQKVSLNVLPYKALFRAFFKVHKIKELSENSEPLKTKANAFVKSSWEFLNVDAYNDFFFGFDVNCIEKSTIMKFIEKKKTQQILAEVVKTINFFNFFDEFNRENITMDIIKASEAKKDKGQLELVYRLIKDHPKVDDSLFIKFLIKSLCTNQNVTYSSRIIRKYHCDIKEYPEVLERMKKKALRYVFWEKGWESCEERFCLYDEILGYLVEELFHKKKYPEAWSLIQKYNLLQKGMVTKKEALEFFEKNQSFPILMNPIWEKDSFNPIEENIGSEKPGHYINLRDFGLNQENVFYIDDIESKEYQMAKFELENSQIIGLDSEFMMTSTSFDQMGIAIFQIANDKNGFIFNMEKLSLVPEFQTFFFDLLTNRNIVKIGHTISADIKMMSKNPNISLDKKGSLNNYVEIPSIFKALNPGDKYTSLAHIAEKILNKPMSKGDQCSNWSKKPLRKSQLHYAALDAVICVMIYKEMGKLCENAKLNINEFHNDILLGNANENLKDNSSEEEENKDLDMEESKKPDNNASKHKKPKNAEGKKKKENFSPKKTEPLQKNDKEVESLFDDY